MQRVATLHWVLVQAVCLAAVLGRDDAEERWKAAKLCADLYSGHTLLEERAWASASLAELCLLRLSERTLSDTDRQRFTDLALDHVNRLVDAYPSRCEFPVTSTLRQFRPASQLKYRLTAGRLTRQCRVVVQYRSSSHLGLRPTSTCESPSR